MKDIARSVLWLLVTLAVIAGVLAVLDASGIRDKWAARRAQAEAARIEARAARERQWPLIMASLSDTVIASASAAMDKILLFCLVVYTLIDRRGDRREVERV